MGIIHGMYKLADYGGIWAPAGNEVVPFLQAEQDEDIYLTRRILPGDVVLDCGACIGLYTIKAMAAWASQVWAVEPYEQNMQALEMNVLQAGYQMHVHRRLTGLWSESGRRDLSVPRANTGASSMVFPTADGESVNVAVTTVDELLGHERRLDWIKIDTEGAEIPILRGAMGVIHLMRPKIVIAAEHGPHDRDNITTFVRQFLPQYRITEYPPCTSDIYRETSVVLLLEAD